MKNVKKWDYLPDHDGYHNIVYWVLWRIASFEQSAAKGDALCEK